MKYSLLILMLSVSLSSFTQSIQTPDKIYGELFTAVQKSGIFPDGKTFVDMVPKGDPEKILASYKKIKSNPAIKFSLELFIQENFELPQTPRLNYVTKETNVVNHIDALWSVLKREPDQPVKGSSLLPLPHPYIVPGGRFREIYYWDSYFTMLGLKESGQTEMIEHMVKNFAFMIDRYGHIPNGNRSYYLSRSQPPFFALMVELLADSKGDEVWVTYLPAMEKEYQYWMEGSDRIKPGTSDKRVVKLSDGTVLNRYWDDLDIPRQESYREDFETAEAAVKEMLIRSTFRNSKEANKASDQLRTTVYRHLRAGAASGWDFSSRWFAEGTKLNSIITTSLIPLDLNCLLYQMEMNLKLAYSKKRSGSAAESASFNAKAGEYDRKAQARRKAIEKYCWNEEAGLYTDYNFLTQQPGSQVNMAGMFPLYFKIAEKGRAEKQKAAVIRDLLKDGGFLTTPVNSGQQWDAPNGWAPLQWIGIIGLEKYDYFSEARTAAERWVKLNKDVFERTGKLMEKYNVEDTKLEAGGGEYPSQDGFGWTNGVLLALMKKYNLE